MSGVERFGQRVSGVGCLFRVERHVDVLFALPDPTDKLCAQRLRVDAEQIRREVQNCDTRPHATSGQLSLLPSAGPEYESRPASYRVKA